MCARENARHVEFQTSAVSHARTLSKISTTPRAPSKSPSKPLALPNPNSQSSCDGWHPKPRHRRRLRVPAHRLRACQPAHGRTGQDGAQSASSSAGGGLLTRIAKQVRAPVRSVTHLWADFVAHANQCFKDSLFTCLPQAGSPLRGPNAYADKTPSTQFVAAAFASRVLGVSQQLHRALRACILCFAARGSFKPSGLTSRLAKVEAPEDAKSVGDTPPG